MFWPGSQKFWRPLPRCGTPLPPRRAAQAARGSGGLSPGAVCLFPPQRAAREARGLRLLFPGAACLFPPRRAAREARGLSPSPLVRCAFSLCGPSARRRSGLRKSLDRNRGLFAGWEGVASLGLSLPLSPLCFLLPPAGMGRLFSGVSQSLCFAIRRRCVPAG